MVKKAKDYYEIMEVSYDISKEDLKRAYYYLAKLYHPDINPRTGNLFKEITEAYNVLKDPIKRREYDFNNILSSVEEYDLLVRNAYNIICEYENMTSDLNDLEEKQNTVSAEVKLKENALNEAFTYILRRWYDKDKRIQEAFDYFLYSSQYRTTH